jgi:histidinol phosphatase-like PHP family hydrolase
MEFADLHVHTIHSWDGTCTVSAVLKQAAQQARLDVIAITDHAEIDVAFGWGSGYILRKAGWIQSNPTPDAPVTLCRWDQVRPMASSFSSLR